MEPEGSQVPATCPYPSQLDPVHTPTSHFLNIHLNTILPSTPGSPKPINPLRHLFYTQRRSRLLSTMRANKTQNGIRSTVQLTNEINRPSWLDF